MPRKKKYNFPRTHAGLVAARTFGGFQFEPPLQFEEWAEKFLEFEGDRFTFRPYQRQPARDL